MECIYDTKANRGYDTKDEFNHYKIDKLLNLLIFHARLNMHKLVEVLKIESILNYFTQIME